MVHLLNLRKSFELQILISLMQKKQRQLSTLSYSKSISTARKHSKDMVENNYFDHTDLKMEITI